MPYAEGSYILTSKMFCVVLIKTMNIELRLRRAIYHQVLFCSYYVFAAWWCIGLAIKILD